MTQCGSLKPDARQDLVGHRLAIERPTEHGWATGTLDGGRALLDPVHHAQAACGSGFGSATPGTLGEHDSSAQTPVS
jgi:hypothetical protein